MAKAKQGDTVRVHYTGRFDDGSVFDSSVGDEPLEFTIGEGEVIPGFERAVIGMQPGERKTERIPAADAYGPYREDLLLEIDRAVLGDDIEPEVGQGLHLHTGDGRVIPVTVAALDGDTVTLDANHPFAGLDLIFDIELVEILNRER